MDKKLFALLLILIFLSGCGLAQIGQNLRGESQHKESSKEVTKAASKTDLETHTIKPLVNAAGAQNTKIDIKVDGLLMESSKGRQEKIAAESAVWSMSFSELYEQYSAWVWLIIAVAMLVGVRAIKGLESTAIGKSMGGGLRALSSVSQIGSDMLAEYSKGTPEWEAVKKFKDSIHTKQTTLQGDKSEHHGKKRGLFG